MIEARMARLSANLRYAWRGPGSGSPPRASPSPTLWHLPYRPTQIRGEVGWVPRQARHPRNLRRHGRVHPRRPPLPNPPRPTPQQSGMLW